MATRPGLIGFKVGTGGTASEWARISEMWAAAGESGAIDAGWMSDHLTDASRDRGGAALEPLTALAALAHYLPGGWLGVAVASNTFRHPAVLAKSAAVLDNVTGGRFILGLGAGWHEGEHEQFGIPLAPMPERFDRYERAVGLLSALFSPAARSAPGVSADDPEFPLRNATLEPPPVRPEGPAIWLGGQRRRGIALAVRCADGWIMPGNILGDVGYFASKRDEISRGLEGARRNPAEFSFAGQLSAGTNDPERRQALETARAFVVAGATHLIFSVPLTAGPDAVRLFADQVAGELGR